MDSLTNYEELSTFSNIRYTPAWYYKQFPGFYNIECYKILSANTKVFPIQEEPHEDVVSDQSVTAMEESTPTTEELNPIPLENKKRSYDEVEHTKVVDHGICCGV